MTKEEFWIHKIKAFLSTSPVTSLFPDNNEEFAREFITTALGDELSEIDFASLNEIKAIAKGFDIPPFIENISLTNEIRENLVFKHPLSGEEIKLDFDVSKIDKTEINNLIKDSIFEIREKVNKDKDYYKHLYFALWRKLPDVIRQKENGEMKIGKYWDWLPADPRIPTHSVWEHSSIVSAIAGTETNPSLLIFTIASPQQFISTARRTQDSWMGSFLYSFLMWEAIKTIANEFGLDCFLFPDLRRQPLVDNWLTTEMEIINLPHYEENAFQIANFPNVLTAILPFGEAEKIAVKAYEKMKDKWQGIVNAIKTKTDIAVQDKLRISVGDNWDTIWKSQTEELLDQGIYWVVCPWEDENKKIMDVYENLFSDDIEPEDKKAGKDRIQNLKKLLVFTERQGTSLNSGMTYQAISSLAARGFSARKNLRDFYNHQEIGDRCTLCGIREALIVPLRQLSQFWQQLSKVKSPKFQGRIKKGDRLCSVCLVKRMAGDFYFEPQEGIDQRFPSTSSIATAPFKAKLIDCINEENKSILSDYVSKAKRFLQKLDLYNESSGVPELIQKVDEIKNSSYQNLAKGFLQLDGQWLFEESFKGTEAEGKIKEKIKSNPSAKKELEKLRLEAENSLKKLLGNFKSKPSNYYAVISMDGDKIRDWLGGKNLPLLNSLLHPEVAEKLSQDESFSSILKMPRPLGAISHLSLSIALKNFALEVAPLIIEKSGFYGKLLYAGGDDLMAFVPTEKLLEVISQIKTYFQGQKSTSNTNFASGNGVINISDNEQSERLCLVAGTKQENNSQLTASIGVASIHRNYPLPQAIEEAFTNAMKENAKERLKRNAVAIHLNKRAGSPLEVGFKWDALPENDEKTIADSLQNIIVYMQNGELSSRFAYTMKKWEIGLEGKWEDDIDFAKVSWWHDAQQQNLKLLVSRQAKGDKVGEIQDELKNLLSAIFIGYRKIEDKSRIDTGWETLTKLLILARFLAENKAE